MASNPFIVKQLIKTFTKSIDFIDMTYSVSEKISEHEKYIEITNKIKDKIEQKTGIHIERYYENLTRNRAYTRADDPEVLERIKRDKMSDEAVLMRIERERKELEKESRKGLIPALIINGVMLWMIIKLIGNLLTMR